MFEKTIMEEKTESNMEIVTTWQSIKFIWNWDQNLETNVPLKPYTSIFTTVSLGLSWVEIKAQYTEGKH